MGRFYITTPIYYVNDVPHVGHAYCTIAADVMARYHRLYGDDVFFLTGVDEYGQNIERIAAEKGMPEQEYCDKITAQFISLWKKLEISNDHFIRTTSERHKVAAQKLFRAVYDAGDVYRALYEGWYCVPCERFYKEKELLDGNRCPVHEQPAEWIKEENHFFKLSKYQDRLLKLIEENPSFIEPESRRNEVLNIIRSGLDDKSISRSSVKWGISVPIAPDEVLYVWIDALSNYISAIGYGDDPNTMARYWPADIHLIGKEILWFHAIIWPALLMSAGLPLPGQIFGHGWLTKNGRKISKTTGNIIDPGELIDEFGVDAVRYFFMREYTFGSDGDFTRQAFIHRINGDLANDLGNLLNRTLAMVKQNFGGTVPEPESEPEGHDAELIDTALGVLSRVKPHMDKLAFSDALEVIWELVRRANKYLDESVPWRLAKDPSKRDRVATILYNCVETLRFLSILVSPFMPGASRKILEQIGLPTANAGSPAGFADLEWGRMPSGVTLGKVEPIFPRIEVEVKKVIKPAISEITIDDFKKVELRVAEVLSAEAVGGADKLIRLSVDAGSGPRTTVAGVAEHYSPEDLVGRKVILVANLKPAKVRGIESQGMLLAAVGKKDMSIVTIDKDMPSGTKVR
jgi:methionyl-tRNA synthetase